ncbi:MAG: hypothetical protein AAFY02_20930 [Pseudomonadota bacterium]
MGMDVYGNDGSTFRATIWSWRAIVYAMELAGYEVPGDWHCNNGAGLQTQEACDDLAETLESFLTIWDDQSLTFETETIRVDSHGCFVEPGTPGSRSPYRVDREHLQEFVAFLKDCHGFEIH